MRTYGMACRPEEVRTGYSFRQFNMFSIFLYLISLDKNMITHFIGGDQCSVLSTIKLNSM